MAHYGLTDGEWGGIYFLGTMASGFLMIWAGAATDHYRARSLATVFLIGLSIFCLAMAMNNSVWLLPLIIFGLRFCGQGMMFHISIIAMARWFTANRGKALAIAALGFSIGEALLPLIFVSLVSFMVWQNLWILAAGVALILILILRWLLSQERTPQSASEESHTTGLQGKHWKRSEVVRHWLFWTMLPFTIAPSTFGTALFFQQAHLAEVKGWGHANFVALFPIYTATVVLSMLAYGWAIDRWGSMRLIWIFQIPMAFGLLVLAFGSSLTMGLLGLILFAFMQGGGGTILTAFWADLYGTRHLGSIKSMSTAVMVIGSAIGPWITGAFIDKGYDFPEQMPFYAAYALAASALVFFATRAVRTT